MSQVSTAASGVFEMRGAAVSRVRRNREVTMSSGTMGKSSARASAWARPFGESGIEWASVVEKPAFAMLSA